MFFNDTDGSRGVDFVNGGGGGRNSFKVMKIEVKVILACFGHISIKVMLTINREQSEQKKREKKMRFGHKKS